MKAVKVSPKFEVVIPREIRRSMRLRPGMKFEVLGFENRIELVPIVPRKKMRSPLQVADGRPGGEAGPRKG